MAAHIDTHLGGRCYPAWCYAKYGRILRRKIRPRHDRERPLSRRGILLVHVV